MISYADNENFKELLKEGFTIVDFFTDTCVPCKLFSKVLEDVCDELPFVNVLKANLSKYPELADGYDVSAVPTVLFVKDGELLEKEVGLMSKDEVMEKIGSYYYG